MTETPNHPFNQRAIWYHENSRRIRCSQLVLLFSLVTTGLMIVSLYSRSILQFDAVEIGLLILFPCVSVLYYGVNIKRLAKYNLRNVGWLKPFIIGFTWAGLVTVYPVMYCNLINAQHYTLTLVGCFLFVKNFMFVTVLSIMFDIKDYAMDYNLKLKTFVVTVGLRKTILCIIIPLLVLGLTSFVLYAFSRHFQSIKIVINVIPFVLTILVAFSLFHRKTIFYYLIIIDGLMLLKAMCGIIAMKFF